MSLFSIKTDSDNPARYIESKNLVVCLDLKTKGFNLYKDLYVLFDKSKYLYKRKRFSDYAATENDVEIAKVRLNSNIEIFKDSNDDP